MLLNVSLVLSSVSVYHPGAHQTNKVDLALEPNTSSDFQNLEHSFITGSALANWTRFFTSIRSFLGAGELMGHKNYHLI